MRALWRRYLAPLAAAAAILSAAPALAAPAAHPSVALGGACPAGTNWDSTLNGCF